VSIEQAQHFAEQSALSLQAGQPSLALDLAEQALQLVPTLGDAENLRAIALSQTGQPRVAEAAFVHAAELMPGSGKPYYNLGVHLYAAGKKREALEALAQALDREPNHAPAFALQGAILKQGIHMPADPTVSSLKVEAPFLPKEARAFMDGNLLAWKLGGWILSGVSLAAVILASKDTIGDNTNIGWPAAVMLFGSYVAGLAYTVVEVSQSKRQPAWTIVFATIGCAAGWLVLPAFILTAPKPGTKGKRPTSGSHD